MPDQPAPVPVAAATSSGEPPAPVADDVALADVLEQDLLVEDVSIDGMCGVY
jgi:mycofactocin precursor